MPGITGTRKKYTRTAAPLENIAHAGTPVSSTGGPPLAKKSCFLG